MATLSCGHANDWDAATTARTPDGARTFCRACATQYELDCLRTSDAGFAYLSADSATITGWSGNALARVIGPIRKHNLYTPAGYYHPMWTFHAELPTGERFACRHWPDAGDYVRMRKLARKGA